MKKVFVAYPYSLEGYRDAVATAGEDTVELIYADEVITGKHVLDKITDLMKSCDLSIFDLTGWNANVALELGVAIGLNLNYRILLGPTAQGDVFADMRGWDQLRYTDYGDLCEKLGALLRHGDTFKRPTARLTDQELAEQPYLHIDLHGGMSGPDGSFLEGFVRNAEEAIALEPMLRLPGLGDTRLGGLLKPGETVPLKFRYDQTPFYTERLDDPVASVEFGDRLGNLYRQEGPVTQKMTPGGVILTYQINALGLPYKVSTRTIPLTDDQPLPSTVASVARVQTKRRTITNQEISRIGFGMHANALTKTHYGASSKPERLTSDIDVFDEGDDDALLSVVHRLPCCQSFRSEPVTEGAILSDAADLSPKTFGAAVNGIHVKTGGGIVVRFGAMGAHQFFDLYRTLGSLYVLAAYMHKRYDVCPESRVHFGYTIVGEQYPNLLPAPSYEGYFDMAVANVRFAECAADAVVACLREGARPRQSRLEIEKDLEKFWCEHFERIPEVR